MKKLIFMMLVTVALVACKEKKYLKSIELTGDTQTSQTIYANETSKLEGVKFKATEAWEATVNEIDSKSDNKNTWLKLSTYGGGAGNVTLDLTINPNDTGKGRVAQILITSGDMTITITVEQKAINKPEAPNPNMRYVKKYVCKNADAQLGMDFRYDDKMRISEIDMTDTETSGAGKITLTFTYSENIVKIKFPPVDVDIPSSMEIILNPDGTVRQSITIGTYSQSEMMASQLIRNMKSRTQTTEFKDTRDYVYTADGYIASIESRMTGTDVDNLVPYRKFIFSWIGDNLSKVEEQGGSSPLAYDEFSYSNSEVKMTNLNLALLFSETEWLTEAVDVIGGLGYVGKSSKHLPKSAISHYDVYSNSRNITYTFDKEGYVVGCVQQSEEEGETEISTYTIEYVK